MLICLSAQAEEAPFPLWFQLDTGPGFFAGWVIPVKGERDWLYGPALTIDVSAGRAFASGLEGYVTGTWTGVHDPWGPRGRMSAELSWTGAGFGVRGPSQLSGWWLDGAVLVVEGEVRLARLPSRDTDLALMPRGRVGHRWPLGQRLRLEGLLGLSWFHADDDSTDTVATEHFLIGVSLGLAVGP